MTKQEAFDKACEHMARQKRRGATELKSCEYRTKCGLKCIVGCLLTENQLDVVAKRNPQARYLHEYLTDFPDSLDREFLAYFQECHDEYGDSTLEVFKCALVGFAEHYKLDSSKVDLITEWHG